MIQDNNTRRWPDLQKMQERRKRQLAFADKPETKKQKKRKIRTTQLIRRRLESSEAMRLAADSAKGNLSATIVYIDLIHHLPNTVLHAVKEDHPFKLAQWRDISDQATVCFYQLAAATIEHQGEYRLIPFSYNLSKELWEAAQAAAQAENQSEVTYLQHRLKTALKRAVGRHVEFWFAYEIGDYSTMAGDRPGKAHLHGSLLLKPEEAKRVRNAFHQLNGDVSKDFKRFALRFSAGDRKIRIAKDGELYVNINWGLYCMKLCGTVRRLFLSGQKTYTATRGITQAAKKYYEQLRIENANRRTVKPKKQGAELFGSW